MTIRNKLYKAFSIILGIIIFIIGVFFYSIINLNNIHLLQNHRYEQIRKVEKIKEHNTAFAWVVLDIIVDRKNDKIVKERIKKAHTLFKELQSSKQDVISNAETLKERNNLILIFSRLKKQEIMIKSDLYEMVIQKKEENHFHKFNNSFDNISSRTLKLIDDEIEFLQNRLNTTEQEKDQFISKIKLELVILLFISFSISFTISKNLIRDIKEMLSKLNNGVLQLLSNDENTIKLNIEEQNELAEITNNINKYLEQKDAILKSREELLRNISHELKTPITKGKFLLEKLKEEKDDPVTKDIDNVFYDIEELVSKLLQREKLNYATLNKSTFKVTTLILEALSKLSIDDESKITIEIDNDFEINGDIYYLTMAVKNLIDNAMKYSTNYPLIISTKNNTLYIENQAPKLTNPLTYYIQPFTREPTQQLGHGLGLNIVNKILNLHELSLEYSHKKGYNNFYVPFS